MLEPAREAFAQGFQMAAGVSTALLIAGLVLVAKLALRSGVTTERSCG